MNAAGGVAGRPIRLLERDDEGKAERAIAAAEELVARHGVVGLVGGYVDSVVAIEHAVGRLARLADQVVVLGQGAVGAAGPPQTILASPRVVAAYVGDDDP